MPPLPALHHGHPALDPEDLPDVGKVEVVVESGAGLDLPGLNPAVALLDLDLLRGETCMTASNPIGAVTGWE